MVGKDAAPRCKTVACALVVSLTALPALARPASPYRYRRVFERYRSSLLQVRDVSQPTRWRTGFLIGAQGEMVFGSRKRPEAELKWRGPDGVERPARLLAYDPGLRLAVARGPLRPGVVPLRPSKKPQLRRERWVVTIRHNKEGTAVPHAGAVAGRHRQGRLVDVPGQIGAPVLDLEGGLLGVVRGGGRRRAVVVPVGRVVPFLKKAVLGERAER